MLTEMQTADIIEPCNNPCTSAVVLVPKKDGECQFCVNYHRLNDATKKDSQPLPRIHESLDLVVGSLVVVSGRTRPRGEPQDRLLRRTRTVAVQGAPLRIL